MRRMLLAKAMEMMARGLTPSVAELAEAAEVSRATAYRYFPTQSALVAAVVDESLGPILEWNSESKDAVSRVDELLLHAFPRMEQYEVQLRAAILVSLQQGAQARAAQSGNDEHLVRGHRIELLSSAAGPLREELGEARFQRLLQALSLIYGTEVFLVLKDIWHLEFEEILRTVRWTAQAILQHARTDG
ncbi:MAG TPA: TetR/AcrR family transcriptional regulator [Trinickia sp.]|jgi:AcrR family transcriptional regulator|uniref:TetR/AcrR family transcriptional regulator n=1 Tax=Trinickia sp. TaxID=2571163 RepID=UPI002B9243BA|nr:TetR/AcrR family transcriptional regulator [Trinickia sp.]HTI17630.1 TetR/AcrR family transcriptional regulator [Trinickia sp.]